MVCKKKKNSPIVWLLFWPHLVSAPLPSNFLQRGGEKCEQSGRMLERGRNTINDHSNKLSGCSCEAALRKLKSPE